MRWTELADLSSLSIHADQLSTLTSEASPFSDIYCNLPVPPAASWAWKRLSCLAFPRFRIIRLVWCAPSSSCCILSRMSVSSEYRAGDGPARSHPLRLLHSFRRASTATLSSSTMYLHDDQRWRSAFGDRKST